jgi:hypothetical protein
MEDRFDLGLQPVGHHRLRDSVRDGRDAEHPGSLSVRFRYRHRGHRGWEVAARGHPVPDLVQVAPQILLELPQRHPVHSRRTVVRLDLLVCLPDLPLGNLERLR